MGPDNHTEIATGRSWRDLPPSPPEDVPAAVPSYGPGAGAAAGPAVVAGPASAPTSAVPPPGPGSPEETPEETTLENPLPALVSPQKVSPGAVPPPPRTPPVSRRRGMAAALAVTAAVVLVSAVVAWSPWDGGAPTLAADPAGAATGTDDPDTVTDSATDSVTDTATAAEPEPEAPDPGLAAAERIAASVVRVEGRGGAGSGFAYADGGLILTAAHLVAAGDPVTVRDAAGVAHPGRVLGSDVASGVAAIAVESAIAPAPLATGRLPQVGQLAIAVGGPLDTEPRWSSGTVTAVDLTVDAGGVLMTGMIGTDVPVDPALAGGPLVDRSGEVLGVNLGGTAAGGGPGLAVPIDAAVAAADRFHRLAEPAPVPPAPGDDEPLPTDLGELLERVLTDGFMFPDLGRPPGSGGFLEDLFGPDAMGPGRGASPEIEWFLDEYLPQEGG